MFKHKGSTRTLKHNLSIASLSSFVAGIVNIAGFLSVQRLTTNVTGHFAFFVDELFKLEFWQSFIYFLYLFFFLLGSFVASFIVELVSKKNDNYIYIIPVVIESLISKINFIHKITTYHYQFFLYGRSTWWNTICLFTPLYSCTC